MNIKNTLVTITILTFILLIINPISIAKLDYNLTVGTNQSQYYPSEQVSISGRLTEDGSGLIGGVCVDISNPNGGNIFAVCFPSNAEGYYSIFYTLDSNAQIGTYNVKAEYKDGETVLASASTTFEVVSSTVVVEAGDTYYGIANKEVSFNGEVTGGKKPYNWFWDFGDENSQNSQHPTNIYENNGTYNVNLLVIDSGGNSDEDTTIAIIENELIANANGPYGGILDIPINFIGSAAGGFEPYTWYWDFGDGNNSNEQNPIHQYQIEDSYIANLTVTDQKNNIAYDTASIVINAENNPPNKPTIAGPTSGKAGSEYEYTFTVDDLDGNDIYLWVLWFEGCPGVSWDGPYESGEEIKKTFTYTERGSYTIEVKAKDIYNAESEWETLDVSMPRNNIKLFFREFPMIFQLLKILFN